MTAAIGLRRRRQQGQAIVLVALMMIVLLGFVALAVDSARAYDGRRVLQNAVDAASLYAADSYQTDRSWAGAQSNGVTLFGTDTRNYAASSCPAFPTPVIGAAASTTTCTIGATTLTVSVADNGPSGQTFTYSAQQPLAVALIQVVGQSPTLTLGATATATASDQGLQPAIVTLSGAGCFGASGSSLSLVASSPLIVYGDTVTDGAMSIDPTSSVRSAGNIVNRCVAPAFGSGTFRCWRVPTPGVFPPKTYSNPPSPPCPSNQLLGRSVLGLQFTDPGFPAPNVSSLGSPAFTTAGSVIVNPGIYNTDPNVSGSPGPCYFLSPGEYDFASGLTVSSGVVSNELRPPSSTDNFWGLGGGGSNANCKSDFAVYAGSGQNLQSGYWSIWLTSSRTETIGGVSYKRESPPSPCQSINLTNKSLETIVSNVPGAQGYNVYASYSTSGGCSQTPGWVGSVAIGAGTAFSAETNNDNTRCPQTGLSPTGCTLGQTIYDLLGNNGCLAVTPGPAIPADTCGALLPDAEVTSYKVGLPGQVPARAAPPRGDLANYNLCASAGAWATCPASITPGAVQLYLPGGCLTMGAGADGFLFSGAQYNWVLLTEPATNTCTGNTVSGISNSAYVGMLYTPGAAFTFASNNAMQTPDFGGVIANTVTINNAGGLSLGLNPNVAPATPSVRLSG